MWGIGDPPVVPAKGPGLAVAGFALAVGSVLAFTADLALGTVVLMGAGDSGEPDVGLTFLLLIGALATVGLAGAAIVLSLAGLRRGRAGGRRGLAIAGLVVAAAPLVVVLSAAGWAYGRT